MRIQRNEYKFVVPVAAIETLTADLTPFVRLDEHAATTHGYRVRSLYYDTDDLRFYHEKIDGQRSRVKLRLRHYGDTLAADQAVFLELKAKEKSYISKTRLRLKGRDLCDLVGDERAYLSSMRRPVDDRNEYARRVVKFYFDHIDLSPSVTVDYVRTAYVGRSDPRFRITIDVHVRGGGIDPSDFLSSPRWRGDNFSTPSFATDNPGDGNGFAHTVPDADHAPAILPAHQAILEVKFDDRLPLWAQQFITRHGLRRQSVSKYVGAVRAAKLLQRRGRALVGSSV